MPFLDWVNKNQAKAVSSEVPFHLLQKEAEFGTPSKDNMIIQGDNLLALRALMPLYAGQVKCIFIDPPYNTQSAFEHYDDKLEHSQWLSMMYPRLVLLRDLLAEDGSIWITLDDREAHYMKVLMDEIFGRNNFVQNIVWNRKVSPANDATWFSNDHDHLFVYAKYKEKFKVNRLERNEKHNKNYTNPDDDSRGAWNSVTLTGNKNKNERPNLFFPIVNPNTSEEVWPPENLTWKASKERVTFLLENNLIYWGKNGRSKSPRIKNFLIDAKPVVPRSVWSYDEVGHTQEAMLEQKALSSIPFGTPKPERLIKTILNIATFPDELVLDSFLGSGTTAAVAQKMNRRYIGIEMGEHARTHCIPRLQKVINGEQGGISQSVEWNGGGGFSFYTLNPEPVFLANGQIRPDIKFASLAAYVWHNETGVGAIQAMDKPYLGSHNGTAYYLLYNGILGDRRPSGGNVLTRQLLSWLLDTFPHDGPKIIYGETSRIGPERLAQASVTFKQIPYDIVLR
ncbi:site-specific DNA-methyltransferase [Providencia alcalifaciens]|jgi:adenine-specific DNA-methyltransferase